MASLNEYGATVTLVRSGIDTVQTIVIKSDGSFVGSVLEYETLERAIRVLTRDPIAEVAKLFELDPRRVYLLPAGVLLLEKISELFGCALQIGKGGLRDGVILDLLNGQLAPITAA